MSARPTLRPVLVLEGGEMHAAEKRARFDLRVVALRVARAERDGALADPMAVEDAAALARLVLAYTGGEP